MIVFKVIEAIVRIAGGAGFEQSTSVVDSGLLGACGMVGLCGSAHRRRRNRRKKSAKQSKNSNRDSDYSAYIPPPTFPSGGGKGSIHSGPPASVLKPEHIRPYKEESDDGDGFIMGPFNNSKQSHSGYVPVGETSVPPKKASGFSRIGGGKAHLDSPYAITGSTHTFPSSAHVADTSFSTNPNGVDDEETIPFAIRQQQNSTATATSNLPPGAMAPFHVRTKSQTAIVENYPAGSGSRPGSRSNQLGEAISGAAPPSSYGRRASVVMGDEDDSDMEFGQTKRKPWYRLGGKRRPHSSDGSSIMQPPSPVVPAGPSASDFGTSSTVPGKSFVVVRKGQSQPNSMNARPRNMSVGSMPPTIAFQRDDFASKSRE